VCHPTCRGTGCKRAPPSVAFKSAPLRLTAVHASLVSLVLGLAFSLLAASLSIHAASALTVKRELSTQGRVGTGEEMSALGIAEPTHSR
jgi:hypothetical protein